MSPIGSVGGIAGLALWPAVIRLSDLDVVVWIPCDVCAVRLRIAGGGFLVPPVHDASLQGNLVVQLVGRPYSQVKKRDRVIEKEASRIVPVFVRLGPFLTG